MDIDFFFTAAERAFSAAISVYLLIRVERTLERLIRAVELMRHCPTCKISPFAEDNDANLI